MTDIKIDKAKKTDQQDQLADSQKEIGGRKGLDPVRYGDWELNGKAVDF